MKNQLIPPPELAPPSLRDWSDEEKVALWAQMVENGDQLVMAGLRDRVGPDGDPQAAFLEWLDRRTAEHDRALFQMITNLRQRERAYAERNAIPDKSLPSP
jgi:hypothetical protein